MARSKLFYFSISLFNPLWLFWFFPHVCKCFSLFSFYSSVFIYFANILWSDELINRIPFSFSECCIIKTPSVIKVRTDYHFFSYYLLKLNKLKLFLKLSSFILIKHAENIIVVVMCTEKSFPTPWSPYCLNTMVM